MPADSKRVEALFHRVIALRREDRATFLNASCRDDAELLARVEQLLAAHEELGQSGAQIAAEAPHIPAGITSPASGATATFTGSPATEDHKPAADAGTVIGGKYKLIEEIGDGGMGTVWMAQQTEPVKTHSRSQADQGGHGFEGRPGALRCRAASPWRSWTIPNIARVFDAGTTPEGRPYFVMELVKGVPITKYCDERKLTPRQRLELFVPVCEAIQHAHQKGIIHRDIKPNNVLVALYDDRPAPKVIDFGVAKAAGQPLTEKTLATGFGAVVGTPEYMSPEQASFNNLDIDTRSDVYALGVLLYELLAGSPPFSRKDLEKAGVFEMLRVVREQEPPKPSTKLSTAEALPTLSANRGTEPRRLTALLRGELDWIVLKALEKDRTRRYETANGFAADVQRYLAGEPVQAVPPSAGYRLRKLLRRNRAAVGAAMAVAFALVVGTVVSTVFAVRANRNADLAATNEKAANEAKKDSDRNAIRATTNETRAREETERVRGTLYVANFGRISDALRERRIGRVRQLLAETKPAPGEADLRGFEWHYVDRLVNSHKDVATLHHWDSWNEVVLTTTPTLSRDGRWAAIVTDGSPVADPAATVPNDPFDPEAADHRLLLWDLTTGKVVFTLDRRTPINNLAHQFIVSSGFVAWGSQRTVTIYDPATKAEKGSVTVEGHIRYIRFDQAGKRMAVQTVVLDPKSPKKRGVFPRDLLPQVEIWDVARNERLHLIEREDRWSPTESLLAPDGSRIAVEYLLTTRSPNEAVLPGSRRNAVHKVVVWDVDGRKPAFELTAGNSSLPPGAFSPDSRTLAVVRSRLVILHDAQTGKPQRSYGPIDADATAVAHSPDGRLLAVGDESAGITLFDVATGDVVEQLLGHEQPISILAFRGNDTLVSLCKEGKVKEWSLGRSRRLMFPLTLGAALASDPTGRHVLTSPLPARNNPQVGEAGFREAIVWDIASTQPRELFRRPLQIPSSPFPAQTPTTDFSSDGRRVLLSWNEEAPWRNNDWYMTHHTGLLLPTPVDWFGGITRATYSWTSHLPVMSRTLVLDVPSGHVVLDQPTGAGQGIWNNREERFSRDGRYLLLHPHIDHRHNTVLTEGSLWDLAAQPVRKIPLEMPPELLAGPRREPVWENVRLSRVFGPGDRYLTAIASRERHQPNEPWTITGRFLIRWDLETGRLVFNRPFPEAFTGRSYDNRLIFSPDLTRIVQVPNPEDGQPVASERPEFRMWELRPDGETVRIWNDAGDWITGKDEESRSVLTQLRAEFTPDSKRLVIVAERQARVYSLDAMDRPTILRGVRGFPMRAAFSDDGRRLVMLSNLAPIGSPKQMELKVWDLASRQELLAVPIFLPDRFGETFVRNFDGEQVQLFVRTSRGGESFTLDGSPREPMR